MGLALWCARRGRFLSTMLIATAEPVAHFVGWQAGFQYYILSLTAVVFFLLGLFANYYAKAPDWAESKLTRRLNLALQAANVGLWEWHIAENEMFFSEEWKRPIGYEPDELPDRFEVFENSLHPEDRARVIGNLMACIARSIPDFRDEYPLRRKDGTCRWILARGKGQTDGRKRITQILGCHLDISEKKSMETRMLTQQKFESIGTLAGGIAHDFNNILSAMLGYTELALDEA
jgi:PAS domain S-box-containing protein